MNFVQVIGWHIKNVIVQVSRGLQSLNVVMKHMRMMLPENVNLDKSKLKNLVIFKFKFQYILLHIFHFYKQLRGVQY